MDQLVVGHAIVARAALVGLDVAVRDMLGLI
jgi:pyridoxine 5'-phosphate synthase PdxJ